MRRFFFAVFILGTVLASGCAGQMKTVGGGIDQYTNNQDSAVIVFMRPSFYAWLAPAGIDCYDGENTDHVGVIKGYEKVAYTVSPGKYYFSNGSKYANYIEINAKSGYVYYVKMDAVIHHVMIYVDEYEYKFIPMLPNTILSDEGKDDIKSCTYVEKNKNAKIVISEEDIENGRIKMIKGFERWLTLPDEERLIIGAEDGIPFSKCVVSN